MSSTVECSHAVARRFSRVGLTGQASAARTRPTVGRARPRTRRPRSDLSQPRRARAGSCDGGRIGNTCPHGGAGCGPPASASTPASRPCVTATRRICSRAACRCGHERAQPSRAPLVARCGIKTPSLRLPLRPSDIGVCSTSASAPVYAPLASLAPRRRRENATSLSRNLGPATRTRVLLPVPLR